MSNTERWPIDPNAPKQSIYQEISSRFDQYQLGLMKLQNAILKARSRGKEPIHIIGADPIPSVAFHRGINISTIEELKDIDLPRPKKVFEIKAPQIIVDYQTSDIGKPSKHRNKKRIDPNKKKIRKALAKNSRKQNRRK
jgi:hypothetical protein